MAEQTFEFDAAAIGAYAAEPHKHNGEVCVEINDGEPLAVVYMSPEEAIKLAQELIHEAAVAEVRSAA